MTQLDFLNLEESQQAGASYNESLGFFLPAGETLIGSIEAVTYFNEETGQCVLDVKTSDVRALISGRLHAAYPGQKLEAKFAFDVEMNDQTLLEGPLRATELRVKNPDSPRTLKKFLKSDALPEITPKLATLLAKSFPENLISTLELEPTRLLDVDGIGPKRKIQIEEAWRRFRAIDELQSFLFTENMPLNWAMTLWPTYGEKTLENLKTIPYQIVTAHQLSFELIDRFALKQGFLLDSPERIRCGIHDLLRNHYRQGHCAFPEDLFLQEAHARLEVSPELIDEMLEVEAVGEKIVIDSIGPQTCIYLKEIWDLEREVAEKLRAFQAKEPPWGWFNSDKVLGWAQNLLGVRLAPKQKEAIQTSLSSSLTVITGGPGTGKTTLIRSLVTILQTQFSRFALCSPTGRAAQRLGEATGVPAQTIHRLLKMSATTGTFTHNASNPLDLDLVLVDEASMVDLALMAALLNALPAHCALILVGDADQIPSVGAGTILQSIIASESFKVVTLTDIFRQSERSQIKKNAERINAGEMPWVESDKNSDFHYIPVRDADEAKRAVMNLFTNVIPNHCRITDPGQSQILVPLNRGSLGTHKLNEDLQNFVLEQTLIRGSSVSDFGQTFRVGDKVMVTKNDYVRDVFNGDIGFIKSIDHQMQLMEIEFDERSVHFPFDELDRLTLAYAISIHKSQGSEYRAVIVVVTGDHLPMAQRHLIYTAVTRGKEQVFLVAEPHALQSAIQRDDRRWEKLTELLKA